MSISIEAIFPKTETIVRFLENETNRVFDLEARQALKLIDSLSADDADTLQAYAERNDRFARRAMAA